MFKTIYQIVAKPSVDSGTLDDVHHLNYLHIFGLNVCHDSLTDAMDQVWEIVPLSSKVLCVQLKLQVVI